MNVVEDRRKPYTTTEAAVILARDYGMDLSPRTVARYVDRGIIEGFRTEGGDRRIPVSSLRRYGEQYR